MSERQSTGLLLEDFWASRWATFAKIKALKDAWRTSNHTMFIVIIIMKFNYDDQNLRTCL